MCFASFWTCSQWVSALAWKYRYYMVILICDYIVLDFRYRMISVVFSLFKGCITEK